MDETQSHLQPANLRRQAEELLRNREHKRDDRYVENMQQVLHELNVYQAELEIQNEELRQQQQELQHSRNQYQHLYDFAPVGYFTLDKAGRIENANLTGATLLGIERGKLKGLSLPSFILREDQDNYYLCHRQQEQDKQPQVCELRMQRADGSIFSARLESTAPIDGKQTHYHMVVVDISKRVAAENALRQAYDDMEQRVQDRTADLEATNKALHEEIAERTRFEYALRLSEERFRVVLQDSSITVFTHDADLRYTWIYNPVWNIAPQEFLGKTDAEILSPEDAETVMSIKRDVLQSGIGRREEVHLSLNNEDYWYDVKIEPLRATSGTVIGLTCVASDVTSYRRAMDEQRFLAQVSSHFIASLDLTSMLQHVGHLLVNELSDWFIVLLVEDVALQPIVIMHRESEREAELSGWLQQMLADPEQQLPFPHGHMLQEAVVIEDVRYPPAAHSEGSPLDKAILQQYARQGIISLLVLPLIARGKTIGAMCLLNDVSGRHYNDYTLRRAQELSPRVGLAMDNAILHAASLEARAEAEAAVRTRDQVFRLISHDLRAPLTAIHGYAHLLKRRITAANIADNERIMRGLMRIEEATNRMAAQIQEIDDVTALQRGQLLTLNWSNVDMVGLTRRTVETCQALTEQHRIQFETTETELVVVSDDLRMERVLTNLITNAIKYSPSSSTITVTLTRREDAPAAANDDDTSMSWAMIAVQDEGIGIPKEDIPLLFQPFHRARNVGEEIPGSGLGLASVRTIVEQHKGSIAVESEEGAGSTFTITLPLTR